MISKGGLCFKECGLFLNIYNILLMLILIICSISDLKYRKVKNRLVIIGILIRTVLFVLFEKSLLELFYYLLTSVIITLLLVISVLCCERIFKKQLMGGADVKLIFMCGIYLNMEQLLYVLLMAFVFAAIAGVVLKIKKRNKGYPFVPFLAISVLFVLLPATIEAYNLAG